MNKLQSKRLCIQMTVNHFPLSWLKRRANRRIIVGCYILRSFAHPVACCCVLLGVVAQSLKLVKLLSQQLPTFLLFRDRRSVASATLLDPIAQLFQHCWGHASALHVISKVLWVVSFPWCTAGPNVVGSCFIRLQTTANTDATTPNNDGSCCLRLHVA